MKSAQKFHSEAESAGAKVRMCLCGATLSRFGFKTSAKGPKGPEGDKCVRKKFHSEAEIKGATSKKPRCGATFSRFGFSTWRVQSGQKGIKEKGQKNMHKNSTLRPKFKAPN